MTDSAAVAVPASTDQASPTEPLGLPDPRRPFWHHAAALLLLLAVLVPIIGTDSAFVTDESFVVIQLDTIERTGGWTLPHPVPEVDPTGKAFSLHGASRYEDGFTLYGKHPALIYLYLPVHRAFGIVGLVALSVLGTWAAALVAARLAERVRAGSGTAALWLVGAGSPLFFNAFVIHAHTIAAALAGLAALLILQVVEGTRWWRGAAAVLAVLAVALLRTEGVLFAGAIGGATGLFGLFLRRARVVAVGIGAVAAGAAAYLGDRAWAGVVAGSEPVQEGTYSRAAQSFLEGRRTSASFTLLLPGYRGGTLPELVTFLGAALLVAGAVLVRRRPTDRGALLLPAIGAGLLLGRSIMEWGPVPGLLVAFCIGLGGLALLDRELTGRLPVRFLLLASGLNLVAVAALQYPAGGHSEWGGRYFMLAVPLVGAVSAAALVQALARMPVSMARLMRGALVASAVGLGVLAVSTLIASHDRNRSRSDGVLEAAALLPTTDGEPPIVVTSDDQVPRLVRGRYDEARFLRVPSRELTQYLDRLARIGTRDVLLVAPDPSRSLAEVPPDYEQVGPIRPHQLQYEDGAGLIHLQLVE